MDRKMLRLSTSAAQSPGMREWLQAKGYDVPEAGDGEWLIDAAERGDLPEMRELLAKGADPNYVGECTWTPLTKACIGDRFRAVKLLLEHKANPNVVHCPGLYDYYPLMFAKTPQVAELLLKAGADIRVKIYGHKEPYTNYVKMFRSEEMMKWHLDHGAEAPKEAATGEEIAQPQASPGVPRA